MKKTAEYFKEIAKKALEDRKDLISKIREVSTRKRTDLWDKLNKDFDNSKLDEVFNKVLSKIEEKAMAGETSFYYLINYFTSNKPVIDSSNKILDEMVTQKAKDLCGHVEEGHSFNNFDGYFDEVLKDNDIKLNLFAEKLISLLEEKGFCAYKNIEGERKTYNSEMVLLDTISYAPSIRISW